MVTTNKKTTQTKNTIKTIDTIIELCRINGPEHFSIEELKN
jgi:hypothetical protein